MSQSWADVIAPIVRRCRLAAALNCAVTFDADGSQALGALIEGMAQRLDDEIAFLRAQDCANDVLRMSPALKSRDGQ